MRNQECRFFLRDTSCPSWFIALGSNGLVRITSPRDNVMRTREAFVSDRKYRQHGYQDHGEKRQKEESREKPARDETFGPRRLQMPGTRAVSRCAQCGTVLQSVGEPPQQCPKCGFALYSCKQCTYFDPSSRFECTQPIPARIPRKDEVNQCSFYSIRVMVEKETSTPSSLRPTDARQAFENLFKKK
jgi:hypothetical protein